MGDDHKILRIDWRGKSVDRRVDVDKCTLLDVVMEYDDEVKKQSMRLDYHFPIFYYVFDMKHHYLRVDSDLMIMFERFSGKKNLYMIWDSFKTKYFVQTCPKS